MRHGRLMGLNAHAVEHKVRSRDSVRSQLARTSHVVARVCLVERQETGFWLVLVHRVTLSGSISFLFLSFSPCSLFWSPSGPGAGHT